LSGFYAKSASGVQYQGMFLKLNGATVKDFRIKNSYFENAFRNIGSIAGETQNSTLSNIYSNAIVKSTSTDSYARAGGLLGQAYTDTNNIVHCEFAGEVYNTGKKTGGIIGQSACAVNIKDCVMSGSVVSTYANVSSETGGFCGLVINAGNNAGTTSITGSVFKGTVDTRGSFVGGFVGKIEKCGLIITDSLNIGNIINTFENGSECFVGGFLGAGTSNSADKWTISNCLNAGTYSVTQKSLNGIIIGHRRWGGTRSASNIYVLSNAITTTGGETMSLDGGGNNTGVGYVDITGKSVNGYDALVNTPKLDFAEKWIAKKDALPIPRGTATTGCLATPDVAWTKNADNQYEITSIEELAGLACVVNGVAITGATLSKANALTASYVLTKDIALNNGDAKTWTDTAPMYDWIPIGNTSDGFQGTFEGNGNTISGIYLKASAGTQGLFGTATNASKLQNFKLKNSCFLSTKGTIGSIAGIEYGTATGIYSDAHVESAATGEYARISGMFGILGGYQKAQINKCWFAGTVVAAGDMVGAFAGQVGASEVVLDNCLNTGTITNSYDAAPKTGGLLGWIQNHAKVDLTVNNCYVDCEMYVMRNYQVGKVIGMIGNSASWLGSVVVSNVHASNFDINVNGVVETLKGQSGTANIKEGTITAVPVSELEENTALDFDTVWDIQNGKIVLRGF